MSEHNTENVDQQAAGAPVSASAIVIDIFASPGEAFAAIRQKPRILLPLVLILASGGIVTFLYMHGVDIEWFFEQQILAANPDATEAELEQASQGSQFMANIPRIGLASVFAIFAVIASAVLLLLQALYLRIVSAITGDGIDYKLWFSVICFCSLPTLLRHLATAVNLLTNDIRLLPQTAVNPLAFGNLLGLDPGTGLDLFVYNLDPTTIWSLVLIVLAYRTFSGKSMTTAIAVVLTPAALLVGLTLAF